MRCLQGNVRWMFLFGLALSGLCRAQTFDGVAELDAILNQASNLEHFLSQPEWVKAYQAKLQAYQHRDKYRCESFEKILKKVQTLKSKIPGFYQRLWEVVPGEPIHVRVFEETNPGEPQRFTTYTFRPVGRRFNGIFNDPSTNGCISDECVKNDPASPDRWGIALAQSQLYYVEKNGMFADLSLLVTPISRRQENFGLVTLGGGPQLSRTLGIEDPITKKRIETSLLNVWLSHQLEKKFPFSSFVKLERNGEWGKNITRAAAAQLPLSHVLGEPGEFTPTDAIAKRIETHAGRLCLAWKDSDDRKRGVGPGLGRGLIYGSLDANDELREYSVLGLPIADPSNYASVTQALKEVDGKGVGTLGQVKAADQQKLQLTLKNIVEQDSDAEKRARALLALDLLQDRTQGKHPSDKSASAAKRAKSSPSFLNDTFTKALSDSNADVRRAGALGLANLAPKALQDPRVGDVVSQLSTSALPATAAGTQPEITRPLGSGGGSQGRGPASTGENASNGPLSPDLKDALRDRGRDTALEQGVPIPPRRLSDIVDRMANDNDPRRLERNAEQLAKYLQTTPEKGRAIDGIFGGDENGRRHELHERIIQDLEEEAKNQASCGPSEKNKERSLFQKLETVTQSLRHYATLERQAYAHDEDPAQLSENERGVKRAAPCNDLPSGYLKPDKNGILLPFRAYLIKDDERTSEEQDACHWIFTDECGASMGPLRTPSSLSGKFFLETPNEGIYFLGHKGDRTWIPVGCQTKPDETLELRLTQPNGTPISIRLDDLRQLARQSPSELCKAKQSTKSVESALIKQAVATALKETAGEKKAEEKKAEEKQDEKKKDEKKEEKKEEKPKASAPKVEREKHSPTPKPQAKSLEGPVACKDNLGGLKTVLRCDCADFDMAFSCYVGLTIDPMPGSSERQRAEACLAKYDTACSSCIDFQSEQSRCSLHLHGFPAEQLKEIGFEVTGAVPGHGNNSKINLVAVPADTTPEMILNNIAEKNERLHQNLFENPREARRSKAGASGPDKCGQKFKACLIEMKASRAPAKN